MATWTRLTRVADCPPATATEVVAEGKVIALFNVEGTFYALDGVCPHQGGPLGQGMLEGCVVTCPWHGWQFDVRNGQHQFNPQVIQPRYDLRVDGEWVFINLS